MGTLDRHWEHCGKKPVGTLKSKKLPTTPIWLNLSSYDCHIFYFFYMDDRQLCHFKKNSLKNHWLQQTSKYLFKKVIISLFVTIIGHCVPCRATGGTRSPPVVVGQAGLGELWRNCRVLQRRPPIGDRERREGKTRPGTKQVNQWK